MSVQEDARTLSQEPADWPAPLREGNDDVALLLRCESVRRLEPGRPFFTVTQKRVQRQWRNISLAAFTGIFAATLWFGGAMETPASAIVAEPLLSIPKSVLAAEDAAKPAEQPVAPRSEPANLAPHDSEAKQLKLAVLSAKDPVDARLAGKGRQASTPKAVSSEANSANAVEATAAREDCASFSRSGQYDHALQCFQMKSEGLGTSAEIGFLEMARIQRRALDDNSAALKTLERYQAKFPQGTLSWEADQLRQELIRIERASVLVSE